MSKKEREMGNSNGILRCLFCCCSNLSIDDIISLRPGLRMGIDFRGQVWKWVWKISDIFLVWNRVRIWRTGRHTPTKNSQDYPPPLPPPPHFPLRTVHASAKPRNYRKDLSTAGPKYMQLNSFHLNYGYVGISSFSGDKSRAFSYS